MTPGLPSFAGGIAATQWPEKETVADQSQGVPLATMQELARYWATDYDWRKVRGEAERPAAVHHRDRWAGHSFHPRSLEACECAAAHRHARMARLDHRAAEDHRSADQSRRPMAASAADAFDVVIPSMPGYGFSGKPTSTGWGPERMGRAWAELMKRLGYTRYVAQGGDWGAFVVDQMGLQAPAGLLAIHTNMPATVPADVDKALLAGAPPPAGLSAEEQRAYEQLVRTFKQVDYAQADGVAPANLVRHRGFTRRPRRLAARPQRRGRPAGRGGRLARCTGPRAPRAS